VPRFHPLGYNGTLEYLKQIVGYEIEWTSDQLRVERSLRDSKSKTGLESNGDICMCPEAPIRQIPMKYTHETHQLGYDLTMAVAQKMSLGNLDDRFIGAGRYSATVAELVEETEATPSAIRSALARLVEKRRAFSPARGLFVFVPAEFRSWGVVPADCFVDQMMQQLDREYYVGLLSAAQLHGAAHQRPQVTQVIVNSPVADRDMERVRLRFYASDAEFWKLPIQRRNSKTGTFAVSSPELTVVDLCGRPVLGGGLDNIATIISELHEEHMLTSPGFAKLVGLVAAHAVKRAGHLVESLTDLRLDDLAAEVKVGEPTMLDPHGDRRGPVDRRWNVRVNVEVEPEA
jgi:predicted transcriptional regulator of viral defense system